jgi:6-phosphogluconate dehydrogenase
VSLREAFVRFFGHYGLALMARFASQGRADYASKLLAMMRNMFGGHAVNSES